MSRSLLAAAVLLATVFYVTLGTAFDAGTAEPIATSGPSAAHGV